MTKIALYVTKNFDWEERDIDANFAEEECVTLIHDKELLIQIIRILLGFVISAYLIT